MPEYLPSIIKSIQDIIKIPSIKAPALEGKPFGQNVDKALKYMLNLGTEMGFETKNLNGYAGYIQYGQGDEMLGILTHLDVVPAGDNWSYPPFEGRIADRKLFGRGVVDDKGPAIISLYAMKALKDSGYIPDKRIRLILGLDEECGWQCMEYYKKKEQPPTLAVVPDSDYPLVYAEKGIVDYQISYDYNDTDYDGAVLNIRSIKGGQAINMVADMCHAIIEADMDILCRVRSLLQHYDHVTADFDRNHLILKSIGICCHGGTPHQGRNAITQLMAALSGVCKELGVRNSFVEFYKTYFAYQADGLRWDFKDDISGDTTVNIGIIDADEKGAKLFANIRYPVSFEQRQIDQTLNDSLLCGDTAFSKNIKIEMIGGHKPHHIPQDSRLVSNLLDVYRQVTKDNTPPLSTPGGTYARAFANAVAFGPAFPGEEDVAHKPDEYMYLDSIQKNFEIYSLLLRKI